MRSLYCGESNLGPGVGCARAKASHGSIKPLLVSLFCGERSVFEGPASRRRPRSGAPGDASDRYTDVSNSKPDLRRLRLGQSGSISGRARRKSHSSAVRSPRRTQAAAASARNAKVAAKFRAAQGSLRPPDAAAAMAELWSLRITVKGATKTFGNVDPTDTVETLAERAAQDFRCKGGLELAGGFPPKALSAAAKLKDVTTNNAALRGIEKKRAAPAKKPATRKKAKGPPVDDRRAAALRAAEARAAGEPAPVEINPAPAPSRPQPLATAPKAPRRRRLNMASSEGGVGIDLASAAAGESGTRGKFFRKALKGAVEGRYEDTKAEDRVAACQSGKFEIAVSETTLSGNASKLKVTFAKGHGSRGNHEDVVDALTGRGDRGCRPASGFRWRCGHAETGELCARVPARLLVSGQALEREVHPRGA